MLRTKQARYGRHAVNSGMEVLSVLSQWAQSRSIDLENLENQPFAFCACRVERRKVTIVMILPARVKS